MENEVWRPVVGFEGQYEVSNCGRVRSQDRVIHRPTTPFTSKGRVLKQALDGDGYPKVALGRASQRKVHKLVAEAFLPNPEGLPEVDHEDTNKLNCRADNLRWCTKRKNSQYRHEKGYKTCELRYGSETRQAVQQAIAKGTPVIHVAKQHGMSRAHVRRIAAEA